MTFQTIDPATGRGPESYAPLSDGELEAAVAGADRRARGWARASTTERGAALLRADEEQLARLMTAEMGAPGIRAFTNVKTVTVVDG